MPRNKEEAGDKPWWSLVDPAKRDQDLRRRLLEKLVGKHGVKGASRILEVDRTVIYRMRKGQVGIGDHHVPRILSGLTPEEFEETLTLGERLQSLVVLRGDKINYGFLLETPAVAMRDPYARGLILRYVAEHYRDDLRQMLETELEVKRIQWTRGFEEYLRNPPKGKRIAREDTLAYYKNLFKKYLECRKVSRSLVEEVAALGTSG